MELEIACLTEACQDMELDYQFLDRENNFVSVNINGDTLHFQINRTPFNSQVMASICWDKEHSYALFKDSIPMPKTLGFLDYGVQNIFQKYLIYKSIEKIIDRIEQEFSYPVVIKKNRGSFAINVFLCHNREEVKESVKTIFDKKSKEYDYIALAQKYIEPQREFRMVCFRGEALLTYERVSDNAKFNAGYWQSDNSEAKHITDSIIIADLVSFVRPAFDISGLDYVGFDIVMGKDGSFYLLELNSGPKYGNFAEYNGKKPVVALYKRILNRVLDEGQF